MSKTENLRAALKQDVAELERLRDEIKLRVHLAGMDAKSAWRELEPRVDAVEQSVTAEGNEVKDATVHLAREMRDALARFRARL